MFEAKPARASFYKHDFLFLSISFMPLLLSLFLKLFAVKKGFCIGKMIFAIIFLSIESISIPGNSF